MQRGRDRPNEDGVAERIEPDVRVVAEPVEARRVEQRDDVRVRVTGGAFELWLEAVAHQQHRPGRLHRRHVVGRQLEIVWLGAGRRQVRDVHARAPDLLGRVGERIEGRDDAVAVARRRVAPRGERGRDRTDDDRADRE